MNEFLIPLDHEFDEEALNEAARQRYAISGPFDINRWPASVLALSMPTKFVEVTDLPRWLDMWDELACACAAEYADKIDALLNWEQAFIRLNSRSPKDASYPVAPITCAGRQALSWIASSERCLDDSVTYWRAGAPLFICLREYRPIRPDGEFRCFARNGEVISVSRYDYRNPNLLPTSYTDRALDAAKRFYSNHLCDHWGDVVFDIFALGTSHEMLIEVNPYGLSDPCCFGSYEAVERGGVAL